MNSSNFNIAIRADASLDIGSGHIMRCLTIANFLKKKNNNVIFFTKETEGNLLEHIQQCGHRVITLPSYSTKEKKLNEVITSHSDWLDCTQEKDAEDFLKATDNIKIDLVIIDHYAIESAWETTIKNRLSIPIIVIDDLVDRRHECDLLIDQTYLRKKQEYTELVPATATLLTGSKYSILRPEFEESRNISIARNRNSIQNILVNLGGVDKENITSKILCLLNTTNLSSDVEIVVVMGATAPNINSVMSHAKELKYKTSVIIGASNMHELMSNADIAIGAAGATTWERCCLGLPTILLVIAKNQENIASALNKEKVVISINNIDDLVNILENITEQDLLELKNNSLNVTDGLGVSRIWQQVQKLLPIKITN
jgi:UDP-2,4-diacetamido-2,4,6-trideoxy-beta-L-altropyranose hydrolase